MRRNSSQLRGSKDADSLRVQGGDGSATSAEDSRRPRARQLGRFGVVPVVPIALLLMLLVLPAALPGLLAPADPNTVNLSGGFKPPAFAGGDWGNILGTDELGRDVFSRLVYGARVSALLALAVIALSSVLGTGLGVVAGYMGGWVDSIVMRAADAFFSLPLVLMAIALGTLVGPSYAITVGVMVMALWGEYARLTRGETLTLRQRDFVRYAQVTGVGHATIMWRHIRPNVQNSVTVMASLHVGWAILVEAGLSFIGVGVPPPTPAWGSMIAEGRVVLVQAWWVSAAPGVVIMLVVLSINLLGDWLRDRFDPRLQPVLGVSAVELPDVG